MLTLCACACVIRMSGVYIVPCECGVNVVGKTGHAVEERS